MKFSDLKVGEKLSEVQYYSVEKIVGNDVQLVNDFGENIVVNKGYVEKLLTSASQFSTTTTVSRTEAANKFLTSPSVVMTVSFNKQVKEPDVVKELMAAYANSTPAQVEKAFKAAVKKGMTGEERIIVGHHFGELNEFGRVNFIDMEQKKDPTKQFDSRQRQVDPRTINYIIVKDVKYIVK